MKESSVEGYFVNGIKALGGVQRKVKWLGRDGAPDQWASYKGRPFFVEFKRPVGGKVKGIQADEARILRGHGAHVFLINTRELVDQLLTNLKEMSDDEWREFAERSAGSC